MKIKSHSLLCILATIALSSPLLCTERECPEGGIQDMESEPEERNVPQPGY